MYFSCFGGLSSQVQHFIKSNFIGCFPTKTFSWSKIKSGNKPADIFLGKCRYFTAFGYKLANQAIRILIGRPFPRGSWMCVKHINTQVLFHLHTFCKLSTLVKGYTTNRQSGSGQKTHNCSAYSTTFFVWNSLTKEYSTVSVYQRYQ